MKRSNFITVLTLSAAIMLTVVSRAQTPTEQPAAPSGSLPAGHPDISQMIESPNSAGAAGSAMPAGVNLPAGHPDISTMMAAATTQPGQMGTLFIHAAQATAGGPAIGAESYVVELSIHGQLFNTIEGKLDEKGTATVNGIPLRFNLEPTVKIRHAGAEYAAVGQAMGSATPKQELHVDVYETTEKQPDWNIRMRHVMVERVQGGLQVMEMLAIENPTDRAWLGNAGADGRRTTFTLNLPETAQQIQMIGEHSCCALTDGNKLTHTMALVPGTTQYQIAYLIPAVNGKAEISVAAPAAVKTMMVFVPDDETTVRAEGLEAMGSADMGQGKMRFFKGADLTAGQIVKVAIAGIVDVQKTVSAAHSAGSAYVAQIVAGGGAVVILLFGVAFIFMKAPRGTKAVGK